ncbi:MAG: 3-isopropylmalate dehydratase small subunit [Candidatus Omnitrophota bacterium]|nr:3-isopropylmalate dehydratase small subunit [Candidatus Omnitrophota bacterium]
MIKGKVHKFGDDVNTDEIIAAKYLNLTNPKELGARCMETIDPDFPKKVTLGDIIVAGDNFGCGSSREHAPVAIKGVGISCVIAKNFARIFFRNSINIGLPILEIKEADKIQAGDTLEIDLEKGIINNLTQNQVYQAQSFPGFMQGIVKAGGLMGWIRKQKK